jgi:competence transcription factor ComK
VFLLFVITSQKSGNAIQTIGHKCIVMMTPSHYLFVYPSVKNPNKETIKQMIVKTKGKVWMEEKMMVRMVNRK